jgi:hypothetical protein
MKSKTMNAMRFPCLLENFSLGVPIALSKGMYNYNLLAKTDSQGTSC